MAKVVQSGGMAECSDADAASCLAQGHPKSGLPAVKWGMKDRDAGFEGVPRPGAHDPYAGAKAP
jgi:hypothetical protein